MSVDEPNDPIFIVGTERSGSNLVRLILDAHPRIAVPHPPHLLHYFSALEARYGDLERDETLEQLVDDALALLRVHILPWETEISRGRLLSEVRPRDAYGVMCGLYEQYRLAEGKARWGCKSTFMIHHAERILARDPDARFIWLVRDPRDVAASSRRSVFSPFHPVLTAELWREQQEIGLELQRSLGTESVLRLRYESLLAAPEAKVRELCTFLGERFDERQLAFHRTAAARRLGSLSESWRNATSPVLTNNAGKYRAELTGPEIAGVEAVAGPMMKELGYEMDTDGAARTDGALRRARYHLRDRGWWLAVEARSLRRDRNHWRRWARDATVALIRVRRR